MAGTNINNAPDPGNLDRFRAVIGKEHDFAEVERFIVSITGADESMQYLCNIAELPGRGISFGEMRYYGPSFKMPIMSTFNEVTLNFYVRDYFSEKHFFDAWLDKINPKSTYDFNYRSTYEKEIKIYQYSGIATPGTRKAHAIYKATLRHAWPTEVASLPLNWGSDDFHKLAVTFTFSDWYSNKNEDGSTINTSKFDLVLGAKNII